MTSLTETSIEELFVQLEHLKIIWYKLLHDDESSLHNIYKIPAQTTDNLFTIHESIAEECTNHLSVCTVSKSIHKENSRHQDYTSD
jgi:hypothetical protein